jgi:Nuclease-related domain
MAWPRLRNRKSPGPMAAASNHGAGRDSAGPGASPGAPQNASAPGDPRQQWKLRARQAAPGEAHPAHPGTPGGTDVPGGRETPPVTGAPDAAAGPGAPDAGAGPAAWPGGEAETSDASFWDWARTDEPAEPGPDPGAQPVTPPAGARPSWQPVVTPVAAVREDRPEGIGQRLGNLAHLSGNPRRRTWQWRIVAAVVIGVVFTIVVSWRLGLTLAVLAVIADTIYRSRKVPRGTDRRTTAAQRHTRKQLARLERAGYRSVHGGLIPDSEDQIDHLVIGPAGVFSIDSEAWDKRMPVRTRNARQLWHGPQSKKERLEHARWESQRASELLSGALGRPVSVRPVMAVYGPKIPWDVVTIRDVDVFSGPRVRRYLRRRVRQEGVRPLGDGEIDRIYSAARAAFPDPGAQVPAR